MREQGSKDVNVYLVLYELTSQKGVTRVWKKKTLGSERKPTAVIRGRKNVPLICSLLTPWGKSSLWFQCSITDDIWPTYSISQWEGFYSPDPLLDVYWMGQKQKIKPVPIIVSQSSITKPARWYILCPVQLLCTGQVVSQTGEFFIWHIECQNVWKISHLSTVMFYCWP